jgi:hypothetical protein
MQAQNQSITQNEGVNTGVQVLHDAVEGCLHPRFPAHIDILVAPLDERLERVSHLIGSPFVQWHYDESAIA